MLLQPPQVLRTHVYFLHSCPATSRVYRFLGFPKLQVGLAWQAAGKDDLQGIIAHISAGKLSSILIPSDS